MNCVFGILLVLTFVASCTSQYGNGYDNSYNRNTYDNPSNRNTNNNPYNRNTYNNPSNRNTYNNPYIPTRSCVCDTRVAARCPPVGNCPSRIVRRCGCCPTCYRLLGAGERCDRKVPVNEMCKQPMVCTSSVCQRPEYGNGYK